MRGVADRHRQVVVARRRDGRLPSMTAAVGGTAGGGAGGVIMFFQKDLPQTEGRRDADPKIKTPPVS